MLGRQGWGLGGGGVNKNEKTTIQWLFGVLVHKNLGRGGGDTNLLTPLLSTIERRWPWLNLLWFWRRGISLGWEQQSSNALLACAPMVEHPFDNVAMWRQLVFSHIPTLSPGFDTTTGKFLPLDSSVRLQHMAILGH